MAQGKYPFFLFGVKKTKISNKFQPDFIMGRFTVHHLPSTFSNLISLKSYQVLSSPLKSLHTHWYISLPISLSFFTFTTIPNNQLNGSPIGDSPFQITQGSPIFIFHPNEQVNHPIQFIFSGSKSNFFHRIQP